MTVTKSNTSPTAADVPYDYEIRVATSFDAVLDTRATSRTASGPDFGVEGLAEALQRWACVLLQARGGAGKTYTANRVRGLLAADGIWSVLVPAVALADADDLEAWPASRWTTADPESHTPEGLARTESAAEGKRGVIVIDGLNEVDRLTGERILEAIGPITASDPQVSFLVTDRLNRRAGASRYWRYATLGYVPEETVEAIAGPGASETMRIPYYLRRHSQGQAAHDILRESITRFVDPVDGLDSLAEAAFAAYRNLKRRSITGAAVAAAVGSKVFDDLVTARCLIQEVMPVEVAPDGDASDLGPTSVGTGEVVDDRADVRRHDEYRFEHHLLHDYLAAWHLAHQKSLWTGDGFDVVTLKASSFDALALALGELSDPAEAEVLVQSVYNWNYYAAAYMLEEDRVRGGAAGDALAVALFAALADKRFDGIVPTAHRVEDALRINEAELAGLLLAAPDRATVVSTILKHAPARRPDWFAEWLDQFSRPDGSPARIDDVEAVASTEPVLGWGAANALRRLDISDNLVAGSLRDLLEHPDDTVRWRAAHALGPHAGPTNLAALQRTFGLARSDSWVAYGALRAQFEQATNTSDANRAEVIEAVLDSIGPALRESALLRAETVRCLEVDPLPAGWHRQVEPVLDYLWHIADERAAVDLAALAGRLRQRKRNATDAA